MILASPERIERVRAAADAVAPAVLGLTAEIAAVSSPTGEEAAKASFIEKVFDHEGLAAERDALGDVVATIPGRLPGGGSVGSLLIAAHIDTVFPSDTPLTISRTEERLSGPGVGDNSVAVAVAAKLHEVFARAG